MNKEYKPNVIDQSIFLRSRDNPGQRLHDESTFPSQRKLWDYVLSSYNADYTERIKLLLPKVAVVEKEHAALYHTYDCWGFAFFALDYAFLNHVDVKYYNNQIIRRPTPKAIWGENKPFWKTSDLQPHGFRQVKVPNGRETPTIMFVTSENPHFVHTDINHFGIVLRDAEDMLYVAHKPNDVYLPEIIALDESINVYRMEPGSQNEIPGVEYWEYEK